MGQSTTLSGRSVVRHMNATTNEVITGVYDYTGEAIVYADTDSCYFSAFTILKNNPDYADFDWSRESIIRLYDQIAEVVNSSFPDFMVRTFNTSWERGAKIKAGRELIASKALFIKKKKYAVLMYDKEGTRLDVKGKPGKLKAMGLDLKRADTPKYMQKFLEKILIDLLSGVDKENIYDQIRAFRKEFTTKPGWEKGTPKKVSKLSEYTRKLKRSEMTRPTDYLAFGTKGSKVNMPGHVRASINWNRICESYNDRFSMRITDGSKVIVCKLLPNLMGYDSVAYPIDEPHLPSWFKELPFDHQLMEETIIDNKLDNLLGVLKWDFSLTKESLGDEFFKW